MSKSQKKEQERIEKLTQLFAQENTKKLMEILSGMFRDAMIVQQELIKRLKTGQ